MQKYPSVKKHALEQSIESKHATSVSGSLNEVSSKAMESLWRDLLGSAGKDVSTQIFGTTENTSRHGEEMRAGETISLRKREEQAVLKSEAHMEYFRNVKSADMSPQRREDASMEQRVEEIRQEIKKLLNTSKQLETTFKSMDVDTKIVHAGKYHQTFFNFVLSLLQSARVKMEEGLSWANVAKGKKNQKSKKSQQQYWNMEKKHGTSFSLSSERSTATQTG